MSSYPTSTAFLLLLLLLHAHASSSSPSATHAVIVSTSRYWFNYRHTSNALSVYHLLRSQNVPDSNIILMLADDLPENVRNIEHGKMYGERKRTNDLYENVEVDYSGRDVTVETFLQVLSGRHSPSTPDSLRLHTTKESNVVLYLTGHGGDEFLKFQDSTEVSSQDLSLVFSEMHLLDRYSKMLLIVDTCQAGTLSSSFTREKNPNLFFIGSSSKNENSYAHHTSEYLGVAVIDRYTRAFLKYFQTSYDPKTSTLANVIRETNNPQELRASISWWSGFERDVDGERVLLRWFFENNVKAVGLGGNGGGLLKGLGFGGGGGEGVGIEEINGVEFEKEEEKRKVEVEMEIEYYDIEEVRNLNLLIGIAGVFVAASVAWEVL
ncbi:hypothetical protein TL16_g09339 [Triparma laevis f. inornata]|uniref:GPI-anchor transamidase n=1 Tax=Triparma laevis f. inornata TaxID=1714386 RepID=A0A9W7B9D3_9STRA|nr:hypothetical protein TL16_g09339 [Triparma laevis f. inornata]